MSYKDLVSINVTFDDTEYNTNQPITGVLEVTNNSDINLDLEHISLELLLKHKGKGETDMKLLNRSTIHDYKSIAVRETIVSNFSFNPVYNVSYNGYNISQAILLKTKVDISKATEKALRNNKLSEFKIGSFFRGVFKPDFYHEVPIKVLRGEVNYKINNAIGTISPGKAVALAIIGISALVLLIGGIVLYKNFDNKTEIVYGVVSLFLAILGVTYYYKLGPAFRVGTINFRLSNIEGNFCRASLKFEKRNRSIKTIQAQLIGIEKVTYDNGSSRSTATHTFFKSKPQLIRGFGQSIEQDLELPSASLPISINNNDFEIIWKFKITAITQNNLKLSGKATINIGFEETEIKTVDIKDVDFY